MEGKPLTKEAIALTEKKMDMSLDEIIKMSKKSTSKWKMPPRRPIKSQGFLNGHASLGNAKVQNYIDSRSSIRQGVLAQRRSNLRGSQFQVTKEVAKKAAIMPIRNRVANVNNPRVAATPVQRKANGGSLDGKDMVSKQKPLTLDARFAIIKEQRMRTMPQQTMRGGGHRARRQWRTAQQQLVRGGGSTGR